MEIIPCTQATLLICKKAEHAITLRERLQLLAHLIICEFCRRFLKQAEIVSRGIKGLISEEKLSQEEKGRMQKALDLK